MVQEADTNPADFRFPCYLGGLRSRRVASTLPCRLVDEHISALGEADDLLARFRIAGIGQDLS